MRVRAILGALVSSTVVLVVAWQLGEQAHLSSTNGVVAVQVPTGSPGAAAATPPPSAATAPSAAVLPPVAAAASGTYVGASIPTRFGNVQVQITVSSGTITDVTALHLTDADGKSRQISNRAAPVLRAEVLAAQSAHVNGVSGATYTTDGYVQSLQSAIDQEK